MHSLSLSLSVCLSICLYAPSPLSLPLSLPCEISQCCSPSKVNRSFLSNEHCSRLPFSLIELNKLSRTQRCRWRLIFSPHSQTILGLCSLHDQCAYFGPHSDCVPMATNPPCALFQTILGLCSLNDRCAYFRPHSDCVPMVTNPPCALF